MTTLFDDFADTSFTHEEDYQQPKLVDLNVHMALK